MLIQIYPLRLSGRSPFTHRAEMDRPYIHLGSIGTPDIQWARLPDNSTNPNESMYPPSYASLL